MIMRETWKTKNVALAVAKITTNALTSRERRNLHLRVAERITPIKAFDMYEDLDEFEGKYGRNVL